MLDWLGSSYVLTECNCCRWIQFNTMADTFSSVDNYSRVEAGAAAWEYRKWRLLEEIMRWDADVVALQASYPQTLLTTVMNLV